ncbi:MAG: hypothetical protein J5772_04655 [Clostridia bacterium]|nr:hypothetical protein [Clostridia bacterium]
MADAALLKIFEAAIDLKRPVAIRPFEVVEGDTGNRIVLTLTDDGEAASLAGMYVNAVFSNSNGISVQETGDGSVTIDGNTVTIDLNPASFAPGMVECELQIYSSSDEAPEDITDCDVLVTSAKFNFSCRRAILNGETLPAAPMFPTLSALVESVTEAETARASAEAARQANETVRQANEAVRQENEVLRQSNETVRVTQEGARITTERLRVGSETQRASAEAARASAETAREAAETARAAAETARAAAEESRAATFAELIASVPGGAEILQSPPTEATEGDTGSLAVVSSTGRAYICADAHDGDGTAADPPHYTWRRIEYASDWEEINSFTLTEDLGAIEINKDSNGEPFFFDELRITMLGGMSGGNTARVAVNGNTNQYYATFSNFIAMNVTYPERCMAVLTLKKPRMNFMIAEKNTSGDGDGSTVAAAKTTYVGMLRLNTAITGYSAVRISGNGSSYKFITGTQVLVEGRNLH